MSRCFPYPPPGYVKNGIRDEALIESIKIKREEEKAKKERKNEKKDKKRDKKERDKVRDSEETETKKHGHKKRHKDERNQKDQKGGDHQKIREKECFEKSALTEEHGQAVAPQNSSDSTLNSSKRQKLSLPPDSGHNSGSIFRIRMPSHQRHKDPEVLPSKEQPCSTSGKIEDAFVQGVNEHAPIPRRELEKLPCSTSNIRLLESSFKLSKEKPFSSSGASDNLAHNAETSLPSNLCTSCPPNLALEFKNLVEDWVVPTLQSELASFGDEDWLFQKKRNLNGEVKSSKDGNIDLSQMNSTTWPRACFLPEADIYALPFTVPF